MVEGGRVGTSQKSDPALRQDAQRNRERLLSVAVDAFTKDANASLGGIAKAAEARSRRQLHCFKPQCCKCPRGETPGHIKLKGSNDHARHHPESS